MEAKKFSDYPLWGLKDEWIKSHLLEYNIDLVMRHSPQTRELPPDIERQWIRYRADFLRMNGIHHLKIVERK